MFTFENINKDTYRQHLNRVIISCIIALTALSLGIAQLLIQLFPDADGSHFHWNLFGVIVGCIVVGITLNKYKSHPYMHEVYYVWRLKKQLNYITRKRTKLNKAVEAGDVKAMQIMYFYYQGCRRLWLLDDNTITMEELSKWQTELEAQARNKRVELKKESFDKEELVEY
ncbi:DUF3087 domain-containing protein [Catenovulum agarivorans]|uniref:DUF3087 domain-containing protein n=1 Tax=Catenovulum agarivorans TaxID=1172192 RepID=UPI00031514D7|nr:DUF3087 domain-containing protein [Catenovulum agarivorans]